MKPHKWAKEIKAWADGAEIEYRTFSLNKGNTKWTNWMPQSRLGAFYDDGDFGHNYEYRIKPQPKEQQPHRLLWDGNVEPIKPHKVSEHYAKIVQQAYEDGFVQGKIYAETGRVSDGAVIPKEPQYLYVFSTFGNDVRLSLNPLGASACEKHIGKIKLEIDDGA